MFIQQITTIIAIITISVLEGIHLSHGGDSVSMVTAIATIGALGGVTAPIISLLLKSKPPP